MATDSPALREAIRRKDARALALLLLGKRLTPSQGRIARHVCFGTRRVRIAAVTQYGKTYALAIGVALGIILFPRLRWAVVSATFDQSKIVQGYIADLAVDSAYFGALVELERTNSVARLRREASRKRMTFRNGCDLTFYSAEGDGVRLMGHGADRLVVDETDLINEEVLTGKVLRMVAGRADTASVCLTGNPWRRMTFFDRVRHDPAWEQVHIPWEVAVAEKRLSEAWVEEQRSQLSPLMFRVLYDALPPDDSEDALFRHEKVRAAIDRAWPDEDEFRLLHYGLDCAEGGGDRTVLSRYRIHEDGRKILSGQWSWREPDTERSCDRIEEIVQKQGRGSIGVDGTGVGQAFVHSLRRRGFDVHELKTGRAAPHKDRFVNLGAEAWWGFREDFEHDRIALRSYDPALPGELALIVHDVMAGRVRVQVHGGKKSGQSPDAGDSACYGAWVRVSTPTPLPVRRRDVLGM